MIKRVKEFRSELLTEKRDFLELLESEILRGISSLTVLKVIDKAGTEGTYGYQILKDLKEKTGNVLIIEDGTLYPILKKLQREGLIESEKKPFGGRTRTYYKLTQTGQEIYNYMESFFARLIESIGPLMDMNVTHISENYLYCRNCGNRIDLRDEPVFCEICGFKIDEDYKEA